MSSPSASEGEIIESEVEKATTARHATNDTDINRPDRTRHSQSRSPSLSLGLDGARDRSGSPFSPRSARGEKRRRDESDDHSHRYDPRRFKVHYEDRQRHHDHLRDRDYGRGRGYYDRDREATARDRDRRHGHDYSGYHLERRSRDRSRSPPRRSRGGAYSQGDRRDDRRDDRRRDDRRRDSRRVESNGYAPGERPDQHHRSDRGSDNVRNGGSRAHPTDRTSPSARSRQEKSVRFSSEALANGSDESSTAATAEEPEPSYDAAPVDEAAVIEERRKRRAAIKAKYKNQVEKPLLVQALEQSGEATSPEGSDPTRSATVSQDVTPAASPQAADSPVSQMDWEEGEGAKLERMEPRFAMPGVSAADYDPTADQMADLARDENQPNGQEDSRKVNADASETSAADGAMEAASPTPRESKVPDMFSESFEDDVLVEDSKKPIVRQDLDEGLAREQDDPEGFFKPILQEVVHERYQIIENLGSGVFANVVRAKDLSRDRIVVLKIIRNNDEIKKGGLKEIEVVMKLNEADPDNRKHILRFFDSFEHKFHLWLVYEDMDMDFRKLLKKIGNNTGLHVTGVRQFARQVFVALAHLKKCNIIHADIKPDNILVDHAHKNIKLADFGTSMEKEEAEITSYLASRYYRAPEVVLGLPFDFAIDMWAAGCTLFELYTGKILFDGRTNNNQLLKFMECRGKFPKWMIRDGRFGPEHFENDMVTFIAVQQDRNTLQLYEKRVVINKPDVDLATRVKMAVPPPDKQDLRLHRHFLDLLDQCLKLDPMQRITPLDALKHPFFMKQS